MRVIYDIYYIFKKVKKNDNDNNDIINRNKNVAFKATRMRGGFNYGGLRQVYFMRKSDNVNVDVDH